MKTLKKATVLKEVPHGKRCQFKEWKGRSMGGCGCTPFGVVGRTYLCKEHFDYALAIKGIHKSEVLDERVDGGDYEPDRD